MNITDVRVRKINTEGKMKAVVSITIDECFVVHDIKIIEGNNGRFIAMPSRKVGEGDFRDIAHPIQSETRQQLQDIIFEAYEESLREDQPEVIVEADEEICEDDDDDDDEE
ncbi:MAG TPA: septation regulator SpoVG [Tissierellia bacterium]|nr:septation regulator SpoVG [Tissierellia bacterium]